VPADMVAAALLRQAEARPARAGVCTRAVMIWLRLCVCARSWVFVCVRVCARTAAGQARSDTQHCVRGCGVRGCLRVCVCVCMCVRACACDRSVHSERVFQVRVQLVCAHSGGAFSLYKCDLSVHSERVFDAGVRS
jgi:hypothetical protein